MHRAHTQLQQTHTHIFSVVSVSLLRFCLFSDHKSFRYFSLSFVSLCWNSLPSPTTIHIKLPFRFNQLSVSFFLFYHFRVTTYSVVHRHHHTGYVDADQRTRRTAMRTCEWLWHLVDSCLQTKWKRKRILGWQWFLIFLNKIDAIIFDVWCAIGRWERNVLAVSRLFSSKLKKKKLKLSILVPTHNW